MYNYREHIVTDINEYLRDEGITVNHDDPEAVDELIETLNDDLWVTDSVTGNASGSYTFNACTAKEYVLDNIDLAIEACIEFGLTTADLGEHFKNGDYEYFDVTIRCYLLGECIEAAVRPF